MIIKFEVPNENQKKMCGFNVLWKTSGIFTSENGMNKSWDEYKMVFKSD